MKGLNNKLEQIIRPTRVNYVNIYNSQKESLSSFTEHNFQLKSFDGIIIECIYLEHKENDKTSSVGTIIYSHSHGSCKYEASGLIKHCAEYGYDLCMYDSRGCGKSGDNYIHFGFKEHIDLLYLIFKLIIVYNRTRVVLWGRSIGCNTVLQLCDALRINESTYLNKKGYTNTNNINRNPIKRVFTTIEGSNRKEPRYPEMYNKLIEEHLDTFLIHNVKKLYGFSDTSLNFTIQAIVLDSPYNSFMSFIKDNMNKFAGFMTSLVSTPLSHYLKNFYNNKLGINLETSQNISIIKSININALFLISDIDDLIPYKNYTSMVNNFGTKCLQRNEPRIYNTKQKHGATRTDALLSNCLLQIITSIKPSNAYNIQYKHRNLVEMNKLTENKSYMSPQTNFDTCFEEPAHLKNDYNTNNDKICEGSNRQIPNIGLRKVQSVFFGAPKSIKSTRLVDDVSFSSYKFIVGKDYVKNN